MVLRTHVRLDAGMEVGVDGPNVLADDTALGMLTQKCASVSALDGAGERCRLQETANAVVMEVGCPGSRHHPYW